MTRTRLTASALVVLLALGGMVACTTPATAPTPKGDVPHTIVHERDQSSFRAEDPPLASGVITGAAGHRGYIALLERFVLIGAREHEIRVDPGGSIHWRNQAGEPRIYRAPPVDPDTEVVLGVSLRFCYKYGIDRVVVTDHTITVIALAGEPHGICPGFGGYTALLTVPRDRMPVGEVTLRLLVESRWGTDLIATSSGVLVDPPSPRPHPAAVAAASVLLAVALALTGHRYRRNRTRPAQATRP